MSKQNLGQEGISFDEKPKVFPVSSFNFFHVLCRIVFKFLTLEMLGQVCDNSFL